MLRVVEIIEVTPYYFICIFNNGEIRKLEVLALIDSQKHLEVIDSLLNEVIFKKVRIGDFGEIVWDKIIKTHENGEEVSWDYDISPEFAYENSILIKNPFMKIP